MDSSFDRPMLRLSSTLLLVAGPMPLLARIASPIEPLVECGPAVHAER